MHMAVEITTGGRLHFGPLAAGHTSSRSFGGIGLMVQEPALEVCVHSDSRDQFSGPSELEGRVREVLQRLRKNVGEASGGRQPPECSLPGGVSVRIARSIPLHQGFGGGTQLALALAQAVLGERPTSPEQLARWTGRGGRSAIGVHGFSRGGWLVDAGKPAGRELGTLVVREEFPSDWPILLWSRQGRKGLSGAAERAALERLPPMPAALTDRLAGIVLRELLPALAERAVLDFSRGLRAYGELVGRFFAPVQGGIYADPQAEEVIHWLERQGVVGVAQSSWGPTLAAILPEDAAAAAVARDWPFTDGVLRVTRARNEGAQRRVLEGGAVRASTHLSTDGGPAHGV